MNRTAWAPPGPRHDGPFGDRFPTQPIAVARRGPAPEPVRSTRSAIVVATVVVAVVVAAVVAVLGLRPWAVPSPSAAPVPAVDSGTGDPGTVDPGTPGAAAPRADDVPLLPPPRTDAPRGDREGALGEADGVVPDGVTVFDDVPAVANLDPALLDALREAATDAADDRITFSVNSGWRSPAYQDRLLREAVAKYGSEEEAARWVSTADTSLHVSGNAIDIGPAGATTWLGENGADHGLCRIYRNEPWHFELRPDAVDDGCPTPYTDPTHDPRMQK